MFNTKQAHRRTLESFKATAAALSVKDQVAMITGGALEGCHGPIKPT